LSCAHIITYSDLVGAYIPRLDPHRFSRQTFRNPKRSRTEERSLTSCQVACQGVDELQAHGAPISDDQTLAAYVCVYFSLVPCVLYDGSKDCCVSGKVACVGILPYRYSAALQISFAACAICRRQSTVSNLESIIDVCRSLIFARRRSLHTRLMAALTTMPWMRTVRTWLLTRCFGPSVCSR
jgi:hypothetical protein